MAWAGEGSEALGLRVGQAPHFVCGASSALGALLRDGFLGVTSFFLPVLPLPRGSLPPLLPLLLWRFSSFPSGSTVPLGGFPFCSPALSTPSAD